MSNPCFAEDGWGRTWSWQEAPPENGTPGVNARGFRLGLPDQVICHEETEQLFHPIEDEIFDVTESNKPWKPENFNPWDLANRNDRV